LIRRGKQQTGFGFDQGPANLFIKERTVFLDGFHNDPFMETAPL